MRYLADGGPDDLPVVELTRRNLETLLAKLDNPDSTRTLIDGEHQIAVRAVENETHYADRAPGITLEDIEAQLGNAFKVAKHLRGLLGGLPKEGP